MRFGIVLPYADADSTLEILPSGLSAWVLPVPTLKAALTDARKGLEFGRELICGPVVQSVPGGSWQYLGLSLGSALGLARAKRPFLAIAPHDALTDQRVEGPDPCVLCITLRETNQGLLSVRLHAIPERYSTYEGSVKTGQCQIWRPKVLWWTPLPHFLV